MTKRNDWSPIEIEIQVQIQIETQTERAIQIEIEVFPETLPPERGEKGSGKTGIMGARPVGEALSGV